MIDSVSAAWPLETLADRLAALDLATTHFRRAGALEAAVLQRYGISPTRFWQAVNGLLTDLEVFAQRPAACKRLLGLRATRADARAAIPRPRRGS